MSVDKNIKKTSIITIWNNMPLPTRASIAIVLARLFQSAMKFLLVPIYTRILTTSEYGVVTLFDSVRATLAIFAMFSLNDSVYSRGLQEFKEDRDRFTASLLLLSNICTLAVMFILMTAWNKVSSTIGLPKIVLLILFVDYMFDPAYEFWIARQRFEYKYRSVVFASVLMNILSPSLAFIMIFSPMCDKGEAQIIGSEAVMIGIYLIIYVYIWLKNRFHVRLEYIKYALKFNLPLIPHYAAQKVLSVSDRIMIGALVGTSEAGIYGLSYQISTVVLTAWNVVNSVLVPWVYNKIETDKPDDIKYLTKYLLTGYGLVCLVIMLTAPELLALFAPASYSQGIDMLPIITGGAFFCGMFSMFATIEFYYKKNLYVMLASCSAAILNIILNYIFIRRFGYVAAAYTTLVCYVIYALLHAFNLYRLKLTFYFDFKFLFTLATVMGVLSVFISLIYEYAYIRYIVLTIMMAVAFIKRGLIKKLIAMMLGQRNKQNFE